jgi:hypothetical protein
MTPSGRVQGNVARLRAVYAAWHRQDFRQVADNPPLRALRDYLRLPVIRPQLTTSINERSTSQKKLPADCSLSDESRLPNVHSSD